MSFAFTTAAIARRRDDVAAGWQACVTVKVTTKREFRAVEDTTGTGGSKR